MRVTVLALLLAACATAAQPPVAAPLSKATPEEIVREIRRHKGSIIGCFERALQRDGTLAGRVEIHFHVALDGSTHVDRLDNQGLTDPVMLDCMREAIERRLRFQPPPEEMRFSYPFVFNPSR